MFSRFGAWSAVALLGAVVLVGCGKTTTKQEDPPTVTQVNVTYVVPTAGPATPTSAASATVAATQPSGGGAPTLSIDLEDIKFSTDALSGPADTEFTIHVTNAGAAVHNFNIDELNVHSGDVAPGMSVDVKVKGAAGAYTYYCSVPGHEAAGMKGTLTLAAGGGAPAAGGASTPPPAATSAPAAAPMSIDLEDIKFSTDTLAGPADAEFTLHVTNTGATVHNFNIDELNVHSGDVAPGMSVDVKIKGAAGAYTYYCNIPGHEAAGMKGTLTLAAGAPAAGAAATAPPAAATGAAQTGATASSPAAAAAPTNLDLEDIKFSTDTLSGPADAEFTVHLTNTGATVHNFNIDELNVHSGDVAPGASIDVKIKGAAGDYTYYCNIPGHEAAGMKGTLTLAAGGGAASTAAATTPPPVATVATAATGAPAGAAPISLDLEDIQFSTNTLEVPANVATTIHLTNKGATVHNFSIDELKINTGDVAPGASIDVVINAPAGTYTYYCNIPGHQAAGMQGTLTVK